MPTFNKFNSKLAMELTLDQALKKGVEAHQAGKVQEADRYYTAILKAQPNHPDANHNMGVLAVGLGKVETSIPYFKKALQGNLDIEQYWLSYIDALIKAEKLDDAIKVLDEAINKFENGESFENLKKMLHQPDEELVIQSVSNNEPSLEQLQPIINLYNNGKLRDALSNTELLSQDFPNSFLVFNIIGVLNAGLGYFKTAKKAYENSLRINPDNADVHFNLGNVLKAQGYLTDAIEAYKRTVEIQGDYSQAFNNMGIALQNLGKLEEATRIYKKAVVVKPDYSEAFNNMGVALQDLGKLKEAILAYEKAIYLEPNCADSYFNLGNALKEQGISEEAIKAYEKALSIKKDHLEALRNISILLTDLSFTKPKPNLHEIITLILDHKTLVRPVRLSSAVVSLLKLDPIIRELLRGYKSAESTKTLQEITSALCKFPFLLKFISITPLPDLEFETLLSDIRSKLLSTIVETDANIELSTFQSVLALHCYTNEYLYNESGRDSKLVQSLERQVENELSCGKQPSSQSLLCLASFKSLIEYDWYNLITVTSDIEEVFNRQISEPLEEARLKKDIPSLEKISNEVSIKVKEQYEANPYPRWVNLGLPIKPISISEVVEQVGLKLFQNIIIQVKEPYILVAGCGTGQHPIGTASRFKNCRVLAIDLSLSSLAYAKRKALELGIKNIEFMHADILDLEKLNTQFDIIESSGVLHHMDNPMAGWKILKNCLKVGGLMNIGLYSELAREAHVLIRNEKKAFGDTSNISGIKSFRSTIIRSQRKHHKEILLHGDFYSLSNFRDLLMHVQEHRFTIPQIKTCLQELDLKFCGFEAEKTMAGFNLKNSDRKSLYDLDKWDIYEQENPKAFTNMYQFWCQKTY